MARSQVTVADRWEQAKTISTIVATVVIPLTIAFSSNWFAQVQKDKELQLKYISLAIQILSSPPSQSDSAVRKWAVSIINKYSEVKMAEKAEMELQMQQLMRQLDLEAKKTIEKIR